MDTHDPNPRVESQRHCHCRERKAHGGSGYDGTSAVIAIEQVRHVGQAFDPLSY